MSRVMLLLVALVWGLLAYETHAGVLVIGDSMSAQATSWPTYLRENTRQNVQVMAQNGRTIRDFTLPNDLHADNNITTAVYLLGGNDAFQATPDHVLAERVLTQLRFLKDRGFKVVVVKVPEFTMSVRQVRRVNNIILRKARGLKLKVVDLAPVWDTDLTSDTVHPLPALSRAIAEHIAWSIK